MSASARRYRLGQPPLPVSRHMSSQQAQWMCVWCRPSDTKRTSTLTHSTRRSSRPKSSHPTGWRRKRWAPVAAYAASLIYQAMSPPDTWAKPGGKRSGVDVPWLIAEICTPLPLDWTASLELAPHSAMSVPPDLLVHSTTLTR
jgi:hypothetical protein